MKKLLMVILFLAVSDLCSADFKIFLYSQHKIKSDKLYLKDVASFSRKDIMETEIPLAVYEDGFVDKREIMDLVKSVTDETFFIYGSAVRILPDSQVNDVRNQFYVRRGDTVDILIKRKSISIEMIGKVLINARIGQKVNVEVDNKKILNGILKEGKLVEVIL
ncbi:MAG: flagella basal body P-ring formation protein FlgA [Spirochaetes bacterium]|nr:flagella basal body P-ring formation protein FlgA [Spirochaetota bacterium]